MFNIDEAISDWRKQMLAAGVTSPVPLDELEEHLRSDVEQDLKAGNDAEVAFSRAIERIGGGKRIRDEFAKVRSRPGAAFETWFSVGVIVLIVSTLSMSALMFAILRMGVGQQILAFAGLGLILMVVCGWRYALAYLPVVSLRWRLFMGCLGWILPVAMPAAVNNVIERWPFGSSNGAIVALIWSGLAMATCTCIVLVLTMDCEARERWGRKIEIKRREPYV